jgi:hypothetical protein
MAGNETPYVERPIHMRTTAPARPLRSSVILLEFKRPDGEFALMGSGFLVHCDPINYAVTARHVVQRKDDTSWTWRELYRPLFIRVQAGQTPVPVHRSRKDVAGMLEYDHLYCFHEEPTVDAVVFPTYRFADVQEEAVGIPESFLQPDDAVDVGEDVHVLGFPGSFGFDEGRSVVRSGTICYKLGRYRYLLDATTWHGDSGGLVCSKPYFGVPETRTGYQWQIGGKVMGIIAGYVPPAALGLPPELEPFRLVTSAQAIIDIMNSEQFRHLHQQLLTLVRKERAARQSSPTAEPGQSP